MKHKVILDDKEIDRRIDKLHSENGISYAFIAKRLGVSRQYFDLIRKGKIAVEEAVYRKLKRQI